MRVPEGDEGSLPPLPPLLRLTDRLKRAWQTKTATQAPPDLATFLPPLSDSLRPAALRHLVCLDLEQRWRRGLATPLEYYLQQFAELGTVHALPVEMIYHEYCVRQQHGDRLPLTDYQKRFPTQFPSLLLLSRGESDSARANSGEQSPAKSPSSATPILESKSSSQELATYLTAGAGVNKAPIAPPPSTAPSSSNQPVVPMVGGYRLLKRIGEGAGGEVWKAEAPGGVEVAVKRLSHSLEASDARSELQALEHVKRLRHNYLAQIHAFWIHKGRLYVAMELADGSLSDWAQRCRKQGLPGIPQKELLRYLHEAAEALDFLHAEGVQHRDIKPANILLLKGHVKVADFGLVKPFRETQDLVNATFCGTPSYMAPEVWENKLSIHSDQWSLAVSYLELRLNRRVFKGRTIPSLMTEIRGGKVDLSPLEEAEKRVLRRALHPDPHQRFPSCSAFTEALEAVFRPIQPPPPRRRLLKIVALLVCLAAGGLLASLGLRMWNPPISPVAPPAQLYLPADFEAVGSETVKDDRGVEYYTRIRAVKPASAVEFILIPHRSKDWQAPAGMHDPNTFYITRYKISREQFQSFAAAHPPADNKWKNHVTDDKDMPVRDVSVADAHAFAKWLCKPDGRLPSLTQWDKAAGRYHPSRGQDPYWEGPYKGRWNDERKLRIAVGLPQPLAVASRETEDDISFYGCRDMAGNGSEWTRNTRGGKDVPLERALDILETDVFIRGWSFTAVKPLSFDELDREERDREGREEKYKDTAADLGFRVVLEPND